MHQVLRRVLGIVVALLSIWFLCNMKAIQWDKEVFFQISLVASTEYLDKLSVFPNTNGVMNFFYGQLMLIFGSADESVYYTQFALKALFQWLQLYAHINH